MKIYKSVKASEKVVAGEYSEMGYEGLDDVITVLDEVDYCIDNMQQLSSDIRDYLGENRIEWFSGPDDAYTFRNDCASVLDKLSEAHLALNAFFTSL